MIHYNYIFALFMYICFVFLGYLLFKDFCEHLPEDEQIPEINFYDEVRFIFITIYELFYFNDHIIFHD